MSETDALMLVAAAGGFCAGILNGWAWLLPMSPERRDAFLKGVSEGLNPMFWWRLLTRKGS